MGALVLGCVSNSATPDGGEGREGMATAPRDDGGSDGAPFSGVATVDATTMQSEADDARSAPVADADAPGPDASAAVDDAMTRPPDAVDPSADAGASDVVDAVGPDAPDAAAEPTGPSACVLGASIAGACLL
ncbi:MAG TPA: hypothetical protein VHL80_18305 [Polyangia bacterium]|nr:hypothetical protein [Polyangia bacterium]